MSSYIYDSETELAPFSPASEVSVMSVGSDCSLSPDPETNQACVKSHRFNNIYEEKLLPLLPVRTESNRPLPRATHRENFNKFTQSRFDEALRNCDYSELRDILSCYSDQIDINLINEEGNTPIQMAALSGNLDIVRLMIRFGADPNLTNRDGWSTLHISAYSGHSEITQYIMVNTRRQ